MEPIRVAVLNVARDRAAGNLTRKQLKLVATECVRHHLPTAGDHGAVHLSMVADVRWCYDREYHAGFCSRVEGKIYRTNWAL